MVAPLIIGGVMAVMASTSTDISNPADATIVRTDVALLALSCNTGAGYKDESCWVDDDGRLHLDFAKGLEVSGERTKVIPVVTEVSWFKVQGPVDPDGGATITYSVTLVDDLNHTQNEITAVVSFPIEEDFFQYEIDGHCVDYSFRYLPIHPSTPGEWGTVEKRACFNHQHEEPGESKPGVYGFQPDSTYTFDKLVKVTNNSNDTIRVGFNLSGVLFNEGDGEHSGIHTDVTIDETTIGPG